MSDVKELLDEQLGKVLGGFCETIDIELEKRVISIICEQLDLNNFEVNVNTRLIEDLKADSLDIVDLIQALEEEFKISIDCSVFTPTVTVGDIVKFISDRVG